jgi:predicted metalloprotease
MRWQDLGRSRNVEDRRGSPARGMLIGGGGIGTIVILVLYLLMGGDPSRLAQQLPQEMGPGSAQISPEEQQLAEFVSAVLADTEKVWNQVFAENGQRYVEPKLVLFSGRVQSACGLGAAAMGPFYCPADQKAYIDLSFYRELKERFRSPGDFAQAYVIAHEIGHHVQNLLGTSDRVHAQRRRLSETEANQLSVRLELQADFYAGVWAHYAQKYRNVLETGDIEEALRAATAIGDDNIQKQSQGYVVPDSFTHGTGEQRMRWFMKGFQTGDIKQGDTFTVREP